MAAQSTITLYDAEYDVEEKTLSPYAVRLRLLLNYRNIPYETVWLSFRDVEATARAVGAPPTSTKADGSPLYTIPFITVASPGRPNFTLSGSAKIVEYIEETYAGPQTTVLPTETRVFQSIISQYIINNLQDPISYICSGPLVRSIPADTRDWFIESRKSVYGKSVEELHPQDDASIAEAWKKFDAAFDNPASHLDKAGEGNYRITGGASYAEFEIVSLLNFLKRLSFEAGWKRMNSRNGGRWAQLLELPLYKTLLPANRV